MAWIQIHQQLKDHRKVLAAADELDIEPAHMLGLLISFWLWAIDNAPDGIPRWNIRQNDRKSGPVGQRSGGICGRPDLCVSCWT